MEISAPMERVRAGSWVVKQHDLSLYHVAVLKRTKLPAVNLNQDDLGHHRYEIVYTP